MTLALFPNVAIHESDWCPWVGSDVEPPLHEGGFCGNCVDACVLCGFAALADTPADTLDWISGMGLVCLVCREKEGLATRDELMAYFGVR